jgi:prepilin peptidase CpaA
MNAGETMWSLAVVLTVSAAWLDLRTRLIPNWLTVPGLLLGIFVRSWMAGWQGTATSLEGIGVALLVLLPLVLLRTLGAGDWKLMGAVGAILGPWMLVFVLLASIFVAALMAIVRMIQTSRVKTTMRNLLMLVQGLVSFGLRTYPRISLDDPEVLKLPFGVAAAMGTLICFATARWVL